MQLRSLHSFSLALLLLACSAAPESSSNAQTASGDAAPLAPPSTLTALPDNAPPQGKVRNIPATTGHANMAKSPAPYATTELGRFEDPFAIAVLPDTQGILVTEKGGSLKLWQPGGQVLTVAGAPGVEAGGQGGLLDAAIAPTFASERTIYLSYSEPGQGGAGLALARATLAITRPQCAQRPCPATGARLDSFSVIWRSGSNGPGGQYGANILFAPDGKSLYFSSGERQRFTPAQDPKQPLGKIFHLTLDGKAAAGNPFAGRGTVEAMTWSSGHRNPYGLAFARDGRLWEEEMGPKGGDELNLILPGKNYGFPLVSNGDNYSGQPIADHPSRPEFEAPKLWWNPSISPSGMIYYSGAMFPELRGSLLICSMSNPGLSQVAVSGDAARPIAFWDFGNRLRDIAQGEGGEIYIIEDGEDARLFELQPRRAG